MSPKRNQAVVAVDFDGTCVMHEYPEVGRPNGEAVKYLRALDAMGVRLILFTMRSGAELDAAVDWFIAFQIGLFGINENPNQKTWTTSPKAYAQLYIDDAALGVPLWRPHSDLRPAVDWSIAGPQAIAWAENQLKEWRP